MCGRESTFGKPHQNEFFGNRPGARACRPAWNGQTSVRQVCEGEKARQRKSKRAWRVQCTGRPMAVRGALPCRPRGPHRALDTPAAPALPRRVHCPSPPGPTGQHCDARAWWCMPRGAVSRLFGERTKVSFSEVASVPWRPSGRAPARRRCGRYMKEAGRGGPPGSNRRPWGKLGRLQGS